MTPFQLETPVLHGAQELSATVERTMERQVPTLADVLEARRRIADYLRPTPLYRYPSLDELLGAEVFVKHENHLPVGAFKVRGGVNLVSQLSAEERERGVIAASTGNHGQSIAYAARLFGVHATICVPENANPVKVASMRGLGAELVFHGRDFDDAREHCEQLAQEHGYRYVHSGNEPLLIAGVGTHALEILEEQPQLDAIIVPVGGGSGAAGACIVAKAVNPGVKVIGVQSEAAPAAYRSWEERRLVEDRMGTFAEGLATRTAFELPQRILWECLDDFVLVSDDEIRAAQALMIETTRNLVEAAGAAPLAAALRLREQLASNRVALIASGGNVTREQLLDVLGLPPRADPAAVARSARVGAEEIRQRADED
jgi:threonine dehydratase